MWRRWRIAVAEQRDKARGGVDVLLETGAATHRLGILAPLLDLPGLFDLRDGEGVRRVEATFEEGEADDDRAGGAGRRLERGEGHRVIAVDRRGDALEAGRRLRRRNDA